MKHHLRVLNILPDPRLGGPTVEVSRLASELPAHGIENIAAISPGSASAFLTQRGIRCVPVTFARISRHAAARSAGRLALRLVPDVMHMSGIIQSLDIDVVHAHGVATVVGPLAGSAARRPVVWHLNDISVPPAACRGALGTLGHLADVLVYTSEAVRIHCGGRPDLREEIVLPPIDAARLLPWAHPHAGPTIRSRHGLDDHVPLIVTVGNINQAKGHMHLAEAVKRLVEAGTSLHLLIVGLAADEELARDLRRYISRRRLDDVITLAGPREDVEAYLAAATLFVFPSVREALGIALLEAMASAKPCIASRVGGIPEIISDGTSGLLVPPADAPALADAIDRLLSNTSLRSSLGLHAAESVAIYDKEPIARTWAGIYRSLCE